MQEIEHRIPLARGVARRHVDHRRSLVASDRRVVLDPVHASARHTFPPHVKALWRVRERALRRRLRATGGRENGAGEHYGKNGTRRRHYLMHVVSIMNRSPRETVAQRDHRTSESYSALLAR